MPELSRDALCGSSWSGILCTETSSRQMFLHVVEARYVRDYVVWLRFSDGAAGEVDFAAELYGPVFEPLKNIEEFKKFTISLHTLAWPNGADFAPEFLREKVALTV